MSLVQRLDSFIFYLVCAFSVLFYINERLANQLIAVAVVIAIIRYMKQKFRVDFPSEYARGMKVFFGVMFLMIFVSPDIIDSVKGYWRFVNRMIPFFLVLFFVREKKKIIVVFACLLASMLINCIYASYQAFLSVQAGHLYIRAAGFDTSVIRFGGHLLIFLPMMLILFFEKDFRQWRGILAALSALFTLALILNGTRIAWLIMIAIFGGIVCVYTKNIKNLVIVALVGVLLGGCLFSMVPFFQQRVLSFVDANNTSNRGHFFINLDTVRMIQGRPLLGVGLGRFQKVYNSEYISEETKSVEKRGVAHAHNNTLMFLAETGVIGCIAFWYMYISFLYQSAIKWRRDKCYLDLMLFTITLTSVMQGFTDYSFGLHSVIKVYFILMALYVNLYFADKDNLKWRL